MPGHDVTPASFPALLVPDPLVAVWDQESDYTEQAPRAGRPEPSGASRLGVGASGEQEAQIWIQTQDPGFPSREFGYDSSAGLAYPRGATFVWNTTATAADRARGWDPQASSSDHQIALYVDGSATPESVDNPSMVDSLNTREPIQLAQVEDSSATNRYGVEALVRGGPARGEWTRVRIWDEPSSGMSYHPCGFTLPSGRIHAYHAVLDASSGSNRYNVWLWYSDDAGSTWSFGGAVLEQELTDAPTRMRVAYGEGQCVLTIEIDNAGAPVTIMLASSNAGLGFQEVERLAAGGTPTRYDTEHADVAFGPAGFVVAVNGYYSSTDGLTLFVLPDAYDRISNLTPILDAATGDLRDVALATDETGAVHLFVGLTTGSGLIPKVSYDGGVTWSDYHAPGSAGIIEIGTGEEITEVSASVWRGVALLAHQGNYTTSTLDDTIGVAYVGGWSDLPLPTHFRSMAETATVRWTNAWIPLELPQNTSLWSYTPGGTPSVALSAGGMTVVATGGSSDTAVWSRTPGSALSDGIGAEWTVAPGSTDATTNRTSVLLRIETGGSGREVEIRMSTTQIQLYDSATGSALAQATVDTTGGVTVRAWLDSQGNALVSARADTLTEDRTWSAATLSSNAVSDNGGAGGGSRVEFGQRAAPGATDETTTWRGRFVLCEQDDTGQGQATEPVNPADLRGRLYAGAPYVGRQVTVHASSGPTWKGERWTVPVDARFALSRAVQESSPRLDHRTAAQAIPGSDTPRYAFRWDGATNEATQGTTGLLGLFLDADWPEFLLELYKPGSGWVSFGTVDRSGNLSGLAATVSGASIRPSGSATPGPFLRWGELHGATAVCTGGTAVARRIRTNGAGRWGPGAFAPTIVLEGADGTEQGPVTIVPTKTLITVDLAGTAYSGVRLTPSSFASSLPQVDGVHRLRNIEIGWIYPFALPYSWGRTVAVETGAEVMETEDRMIRTRTLAPARRVYEIGWADGIDQTQVESDEADADFARPSAGSWGTGSPYGVAYALSGLIREVDGPRRPVVYIPKLYAQQAPGTVRVYNRHRDAALVRLSERIRVEVRQGEEHESEVVNVATVSATEEV